MVDACSHRWAVIRNDGAFCRDCGEAMKWIAVSFAGMNQSDESAAYSRGYAAGYAAAKAEMLSKLDTFNPVYVEGGRVPEDAIEHRNQPRAKE